MQISAGPQCRYIRCSLRFVDVPPALPTHRSDSASPLSANPAPPSPSFPWASQRHREHRSGAKKTSYLSVSVPTSLCPPPPHQRCSCLNPGPAPLVRRAPQHLLVSLLPFIGRLLESVLTCCLWSLSCPCLITF